MSESQLHGVILTKHPPGGQQIQPMLLWNDNLHPCRVNILHIIRVISVNIQWFSSKMNRIPFPCRHPLPVPHHPTGIIHVIPLGLRVSNPVMIVPLHGKNTNHIPFLKLPFKNSVLDIHLDPTLKHGLCPDRQPFRYHVIIVIRTSDKTSG